MSAVELNKSSLSSTSKVRQRAARLSWTGRAPDGGCPCCWYSSKPDPRSTRIAAYMAPHLLQDDASAEIDHLSSAFRLHSAALEMVARVATTKEDMSGRRSLPQQDAFTSSDSPSEKFADAMSTRSSRDQPLQNRRLGAVQLDAISVSIKSLINVSCRCC